MKLIITILIMVSPFCATAQTAPLHAGVYSPSAKVERINSNLEKHTILAGKTLDLQTFDVYTLTLSPNASYIPPAVNHKFEQLIIVKDGNIKITVNDNTKTYGPGSIALILAGDKISFQNTSASPASWYVLNYDSKNHVNIKRGNDAGPSFIKNWNLLKVTTSEKSDVRPVFDRPTTMFERFEVHATALNPGYASHDPHTHRAEELILLLTGTVQEHIDTKKFMAKAGDCIYLSSGILHGPKNIGSIQSSYFAIQWHNLKTD